MAHSSICCLLSGGQRIANMTKPSANLLECSIAKYVNIFLNLNRVNPITPVSTVGLSINTFITKIQFRLILYFWFTLAFKRVKILVYSQIRYSTVFSHFVLYLCKYSKMYYLKLQTMGSGSLSLYLLLAVLKEKWCHCTSSTLFDLYMDDWYQFHWPQDLLCCPYGVKATECIRKGKRMRNASLNDTVEEISKFVTLTIVQKVRCFTMKHKMLIGLFSRRTWLWVLLLYI